MRNNGECYNILCLNMWLIIEYIKINVCRFIFCIDICNNQLERERRNFDTYR